MTISLSTITSRGVSIQVGPVALPEAAGGVAIAYGLHDGPAIFTLTVQEASQLAGAVVEQLDPGCRAR